MDREESGVVKAPRAGLEVQPRKPDILSSEEQDDGSMGVTRPESS